METIQHFKSESPSYSISKAKDSMQSKHDSNIHFIPYPAIWCWEADEQMN